jgi:hypothetical protein
MLYVFLVFSAAMAPVWQVIGGSCRIPADDVEVVPPGAGHWRVGFHPDRNADDVEVVPPGAGHWRVGFRPDRNAGVLQESPG